MFLANNSRMRPYGETMKTLILALTLAYAEFAYANSAEDIIRKQCEASGRKIVTTQTTSKDGAITTVRSCENSSPTTAQDPTSASAVQANPVAETGPVTQSAPATQQEIPEKKAPAKPKSCTVDDVTKFKKAYIELQNALKYEGKNVELIKGKSKAIGNEADADNSPGEKIEKALYRQYQNALVKVGKVYQKINHDPSSEDNKIILKDNPDISKFFKAIDSKDTNDKERNRINFDTLITELKKNEVKGFELSPEDIYLLKNLIIHSQDRICTLDKYKGNKKSFKTKYLENIARSPLNKMIESLKGLSKDQDLQLADEDKTISEAVKDSLKQMHDIIANNKYCLKKFSKSPDLGDRVQSCNYSKFMKAISSGENFDQIEAILHFINANQHSKNARTDLDWLNSQFKSIVKLPEAPAETEEQKCTKDTKKEWKVVDGKGTCTDRQEPASESEEAKCKKDDKKDWKDGQCVDKQAPPTPESEEDKCNKKIAEDKDPDTGRQLNTWSWNGKECKQKESKKADETQAAAPADEKATPTYPPTQPPGRFQPINIPGRQPFILPGMP